MGEITTIIGDHKINITSAHAETGKYNGKTVGYVHIFLGKTIEKEIYIALDKIRKLQLIQGDIKLFRILEDE